MLLKLLKSIKIVINNTNTVIKRQISIINWWEKKERFKTEKKLICKKEFISITSKKKK